MILVVDDLRLFDEYFDGIPVFYAINSKEALKILKNNYENIEEIFLDHDLGIVDGKIDDVMPVLNWIEEHHCISSGFPKLKGIRILTNNPVGYKKIKALERYFKILPTPKHTGIRKES